MGDYWSNGGGRSDCGCTCHGPPFSDPTTGNVKLDTNTVAYVHVTYISAGVAEFIRCYLLQRRFGRQSLNFDNYSKMDYNSKSWFPTLLCTTLQKEDIAPSGFNSRSGETFDVLDLSTALNGDKIGDCTGSALGPFSEHPPES